MEGRDKSGVDQRTTTASAQSLFLAQSLLSVKGGSDRVSDLTVVTQQTYQDLSFLPPQWMQGTINQGVWHTVALPSQEFTQILLKKKEISLDGFRHQTKEWIIRETACGTKNTDSAHTYPVCPPGLSSLHDALSQHGEVAIG